RKLFHVSRTRRVGWPVRTAQRPSSWEDGKMGMHILLPQRCPGNVLFGGGRFPIWHILSGALYLIILIHILLEEILESITR
ncbi:hypothetical protein ACTP13_26380, partial [Paenibacillus peoriae]|uniref:hypothetical protein n=1 Tax=Paenibacillus peoriae TaxID=59893 RepID=UPI003F9BB8E9